MCTFYKLINKLLNSNVFSWCGPCKTLGPRLESLIASKEGMVILAKIDVDKNGNMAMEYGVSRVGFGFVHSSGRVWVYAAVSTLHLL